MRRSIIGVAAAAVTALVGVIPAHAQESLPINVIVTEGVGRVCGAADLKNATERTLYGNAKGRTTPGGPNADRVAWCVYPGTEGYDAPANPGTVSHPQWWVAGYKDGSKFQGLFFPGVGPGANGPYSLEILRGSTTPPANVCIDSVEGPGCGTRLVGRLTPAPTNGFGAHAGSSHGEGTFTFSSATGAVSNSGELGWDNSLATVLPLSGSVNAGDGAGNSIIGFSSSRGVTGDTNAGNAGVTAPTSGFQTEGFIVQYS